MKSIKMMYMDPDLDPKVSNRFCFVKVYDISYDSNGYPLFLIYHNEQWLRKSAKYFQPFEYE